MTLSAGLAMPSSKRFGCPISALLITLRHIQIPDGDWTAHQHRLQYREARITCYQKARLNMKVAHVGATGKVGSKILDELLRRGHTVTAISRNPDKAPARKGVVAAQGDVSDPDKLAAIIRGHEAVISSAPFSPGSSPGLLDAVRKSGVKRYIAVGGAGSLEVAPGKLLKDSSGIPAEWLPSINEGAEMLRLLRADKQLDWTFFSPAALIGPGERTGKFRLGKDQLITAADGKSSISYDDYAIALVDELEKPRHIRQRFTIGY
jgi:putative NADH-flavin reductase